MEGYFDSLLMINIKGQLHDCTKFADTANTKLSKSVREMENAVKLTTPFKDRLSSSRQSINELLELTPAVIDDLKDCDQIGETYFKGIEFETEHSSIDDEIDHIEEALKADSFKIMGKLFDAFDEYRKGDFYEFGYELALIMLILIG